MIMSKDAIVTASEMLLKEDSYHQQYGIIFETMVELFTCLLYTSDLEDSGDETMEDKSQEKPQRNRGHRDNKNEYRERRDKRRCV